MKGEVQWILEWLQRPYSSYSTDAFIWRFYLKRHIYNTSPHSLYSFFFVVLPSLCWKQHGCICDWSPKPVIFIHSCYFCSSRLKVTFVIVYHVAPKRTFNLVCGNQLRPCLHPLQTLEGLVRWQAIGCVHVEFSPMKKIQWQPPLRNGLRPDGNDGCHR